MHMTKREKQLENARRDGERSFELALPMPQYEGDITLQYVCEEAYNQACADMMTKFNDGNTVKGA